jgi:hypothetical protein
MFSNDIKKGDKLVLHDGSKAEMMDNGRGNTRLCSVHGICDDIGSIYVWKIAYRIEADGSHTKVELTPQQLKVKATVSALGF